MTPKETTCSCKEGGTTLTATPPQQLSIFLQMTSSPQFSTKNADGLISQMISIELNSLESLLMVSFIYPICT